MDNQSGTLRTGPKDVFLHLLALITLYASATALAVLLFQYINLAFPAVGREAYWMRDSALSAIRFAVSTLIVVFPVYFWTTRLLRKMYEADAERRNLGIRKWLSYLTLFLAAGISIGWLVSVINKFLEGDFTTAFLLKALVIFFITGSAFYYYRAVTRGEENQPNVRYYGYFVAVIVLASVLAAFFTAGSPQARRFEKVDAERRADLQNIQYQIGNYFETKGKLPASLSDITGAFGDFSVPKDPETGAAYEYTVKGETTFEICAEFHRAFDATNANSGYDLAYPKSAGAYGPAGENWSHSAGRQCFERTLDKDYFKPATQPEVVR